MADSPALWTIRLVFGTYKQTGAPLAAQVNLALSRGFTSFDTASLYRNDAALGALLAAAPHPTLTTTKIHRAEHPQALRARVRSSVEALDGPASVSAVLLHRPLAAAHYATLAAEASALGVPVGVSNFRADDLRRLCDAHAPPERNQLEVHPFVPGLIADVRACEERGVAVQGHTVLARARFLSWPPLVAMAARIHASPAQLLLRFALQTVGDGGTVVVNSGDAAHLDELIVAADAEGDRRWTLSVEALAEMRAWSLEATGAPMRFYVHPPMPPVAFVSSSEDVEEYIQDVVRLLQEDLKAMGNTKEGGSSQTKQVSPTVYALPPGFGTRSIKTDEISRLIAARMFPTSRHPITLYIDLIKRLRGACVEQQKLFNESGGGRSCAMRHSRVRLGSGDAHVLSQEVLEPVAMPVKTAALDELRPFFHYLSSDSPNAVPTKGGALFVRGCLFSDGRMDMCKQVVGSEHIAKLCEAVFASRSTGKVRHFLLGNNVCCAEDPKGGASALATLMTDSTLSIETFYLAGNAIDANAMAIIGAALTGNTVTKTLWLKRNPLKATSAGSLRDMLAQNRTLELLDLDNTGLLDEGIEHIFFPLAADRALLLPLRHLYLGACGISARGSTAIASFITSPAASNLETLYLSMNPIGTPGAISIAMALCSLASTTGKAPALKRLSFASTRITSEALPAIVDVAIACELVCLDLGYYKATRDMGERSNTFDSSALNELERLVRTSSSLEYLSVMHSGLSEVVVLKLREAAAQSAPRLRLDDGLKRFSRGKQSPEVMRAGVRHPACVQNIDSIYRGKA